MPARLSPSRSATRMRAREAAVSAVSDPEKKPDVVNSRTIDTRIAMFSGLESSVHIGAL